MRASASILLGLSALSAAAARTTDNVARQSNDSSSMTGQVVCVEDIMCISGSVMGDEATYVMQTTGQAPVGYMAMGFGTKMSNSQMVIMWGNSNGTFTLSQRTAKGHSMPTPESTLPFTASVEESGSSLLGRPKFAFTIPYNASNADYYKDIVFAYSTLNPDDASPDAMIKQHVQADAASLDLTASISASAMNSFSDPVDAFTGSTGLLKYQMILVAHGIICVIAYMLILPLGGIVARYVRSYSPIWYKAHWVNQFAVGGVFVVIGCALGLYSGASNGDSKSVHKPLGIVLFVFYFLQIFMGYAIHRWKPQSWAVEGRRPIQNYFHVFFGLLIIILSFYQVRTGYDREWERATGRKISIAADVIWYIWLVFVALIYLGGLALVPRQFRQEREPKTMEHSMSSMEDK